tara:strand:- start:515 stop:628 length:114 start_codon:yes stop_codon:yes gene_type:complete
MFICGQEAVAVVQVHISTLSVVAEVVDMPNTESKCLI